MRERAHHEQPLDFRLEACSCTAGSAARPWRAGARVRPFEHPCKYSAAEAAACWAEDLDRRGAGRADFLFRFEVIPDPRLALATLGELANMSSVRAIDDKTFVISWKTLSINANTNSTEGIPAMPRHQLEELYRSGDVDAFESSPAWRS